MTEDLEEIETLVEGVRGGEPDSFGALLDRFQARMIRLSEVLCGDQERAIQTAEEILSEACRSRETLPCAERLSGWLMETVYSRSRGRPPSGREEADDLDEALAALDEPRRRPLMLSVHGGLSYEDIGRLSESTATSIQAILSETREGLVGRLWGDQATPREGLAEECCVIRDMMSPMLDGVLTNDENDVVGMHMMECEPCRIHNQQLLELNMRMLEVAEPDPARLSRSRRRILQEAGVEDPAANRASRAPRGVLSKLLDWALGD